MPACLVVIPTYNERENISQVIRAVMALEPQMHCLIVDDNSPDGTAGLAEAEQAQFPGRVFLEKRAGKQGLGTAYLHGFRWGLAHGYEFLFEMDADFSHDPNDLPRLLAPCRDEGYDLVIGSRYVNGVNVVNWPMSRVLMSYYASAYVRLITRMKIRDTTAGFKCYRRHTLETIMQRPMRFVGYAFQIEMKFRAWKYGFKLTEVPIIFRDRTNGQSKMSGGIFREAVFGVLWMKISSWFQHWER